MEIEIQEKVFCPVMEGVLVDKEVAEKENRVREYRGKKYYLCCEPCVTMFELSPEQYAK